MLYKNLGRLMGNFTGTAGHVPAWLGYIGMMYLIQMFTQAWPKRFEYRWLCLT